MILFISLLISATALFAENTDNTFKYISGYGNTGKEIIDIFRRTDPILGDLCSETGCRMRCDKMVDVFANLSRVKSVCIKPEGEPSIDGFDKALVIFFFRSFMLKKTFDRAYAACGDRVDAKRIANKESTAIAEKFYAELVAYKAAHPELLEDDALDAIIGDIVFQEDSQINIDSESSSEECSDAVCDGSK